MVWFKPWTWFSRNAQVVLANANTNVLKSALRNYIKAVNNLPNKNNAHIYGLVMKTANGANASYKNRIVNGVAKIVAASRRALPQAAEAVVTGAPEGPAAEAVNTATAAVNNLNALMAKPINSLTTSELIRLSNKTNISNNTRRSLATAINTKLAALAPNNSNTREALEISRNKLIPKPPAANRTALNAVLAETTNQKLQSNINNRNKAAALQEKLRSAATAAGVNLSNKNVSAALNRIMAHESRLPVKAGTTVTNRSRLNAALAKSQNQMLGTMTNRAQVNALLTEVRNAAKAAGVNLSAPNVNTALNRIVRYQSTLNP